MEGGELSARSTSVRPGEGCIASTADRQRRDDVTRTLAPCGAACLRAGCCGAPRMAPREHSARTAGRQWGQRVRYVTSSSFGPTPLGGGGDAAAYVLRSAMASSSQQNMFQNHARPAGTRRARRLAAQGPALRDCATARRPGRTVARAASGAACWVRIPPCSARRNPRRTRLTPAGPDGARQPTPWIDSRAGGNGTGPRNRRRGVRHLQASCA